MILGRRIAAVAACLAVVTAAVAGVSSPKHLTGRVISVHDGDTISVLVGRHPVKVRLEGIDCPELGQPYGRVAKLFTSEHVFGKTVEVEQTTIDRYGRSVGRVFVNGEDLNNLIISAGLAWHYTQYSNDRALDVAEQSARAAHRGLWSQPNPTPPWVYRRPHASSAPASRGVAPVARRAPATKSALPSLPVSGPFHGNVASRVFHAPGCPNYDCKNCTAVFTTREEALAHGYKPARDCLGPGRK